MELIVVRVVAVLVAVVGVTLTQSRYGHALGGRIAGLPLTGGPFLLVVGVEHGAGTAAQAAAGGVSGLILVVIFSLAYTHVSLTRGPAATTVAAVVVMWSVLGALAATRPPLWVPAIAVLGSVATGLRGWSPTPVPPARMGAAIASSRAAVGALFAIVLPIITPYVGARTTGMLAVCPVVLVATAATTHRRSGVRGVEMLARGAVTSAPVTLAFFLTAAVTVGPLGVAGGVACAVVAMTLAAFFVPRLARRWETRGPVLALADRYQPDSKVA